MEIIHQTHMKPISSGLYHYLQCPKCGSTLRGLGDEFLCQKTSCEAQFPMHHGIPILIDETKSVFTMNDFLNEHELFFKKSNLSLLRRLLQLLPHRFVPNFSENLKSKENFKKLTNILNERSSPSKVLILGGSIKGEGIDPLLNAPNIELLETDVAFGPRTQLVCDAHQLPLAGETFDLVIAQAVLEHVVDPIQCVSEMFRVLKPNGIVYAETPFMQQVHGGRYDFNRFTHLGHRRLFRRFSEIESGMLSGPGSALSWSMQYFLISFTRSKILRDILFFSAMATTFWFRVFDKILVKNPASIDAACGLYFIGEKSPKILSDKELVQQYRGGIF